MGESAKASLGGTAFVSGIILICVFVLGIPSSTGLWEVRVACLVVFLTSSATLFWAMTREDIVPDFLRRFHKRPFERDGVCFAIVPTVKNGLTFLNIIFQNQYASACAFRIVVAQYSGFLGSGEEWFPGISLDIQCASGAFGAASVPMGVPAFVQGKRVQFQVSAATRYSGGRGKLLRFRNGLRVGEADASGLGSAALTVALLAVGHISIRRPASIVLTMPSDVVEYDPISEELLANNFWSLGDPLPAGPRKFEEWLARMTEDSVNI